MVILGIVGPEHANLPRLLKKLRSAGRYRTTITGQGA